MLPRPLTGTLAGLLPDALWIWISHLGSSLCHGSSLPEPRPDGGRAEDRGSPPLGKRHLSGRDRGARDVPVLESAPPGQELGVQLWGEGS